MRTGLCRSDAKHLEDSEGLHDIARSDIIWLESFSNENVNLATAETPETLQNQQCDSLHEPGLQTSGCYKAWRAVVKLEESKEGGGGEKKKGKRDHVICVKCKVF